MREALLNAVTENDIRAVALTLVARAKDGEMAAIRELLDRVIGKVTQPEVDALEPDPLKSLTDDQLKAVANTIMENRGGLPRDR